MGTNELLTILALSHKQPEISFRLKNNNNYIC